MGAVAGFVGGLVATAAMAGFQAAWTALQVPPDTAREGHRRKRRLRHSGIGVGNFAQAEPRSHEQALSAGELLVERMARPFSDQPLDPETRAALGSLAHYAFGATAGAVYGALADRAPVVTKGQGLLYSTLLWLVADEIGVPLAGIAPLPHESPARLHAYSLGAHFAYGLTLEQVHRALGAKRSESARRNHLTRR